MKVINNLELNNIYYYMNERVELIKIFKEIHMVKIRSILTKYNKIVDINGVTEEPYIENCICINLLGANK